MSFGCGAHFSGADLRGGHGGAFQLILFRAVQGFGGAFLMANSAEILTDAFPAHQRGLALGINGVAITDRRLGFLVSVPIGVAGTMWPFVSLK